MVKLKYNLLQYRYFTLLCLSICFFLLFMLLFPLEVQAAVFDPPSTDRSVEYLGYVFGGNIGGIELGVSGYSHNFLGNLFQNLNGIVLSIAVVILSYTGILSVVNTAQEGEIMGKKWSSVWIPLRSSMGLLLLAPIPGSGYSLAQVAIVWIVLNGIGAADFIWNMVVDSMYLEISPGKNIKYNPVTESFLLAQAQNLAVPILKSLVCMEVFNKYISNETWNNIEASMGINYTQGSIRNHNTLVGSIKFGANTPNDTYGRMREVCGKIEITATYDDAINALLADRSNLDQRDNIVRKIYEIKKLAISSLINASTFAAKNIVDLLSASGGSASDVSSVNLSSYFSTSGVLSEGILSYVNIMKGLTANQLIIGSSAKSIASDRQEQLLSAKKLGWILAGAYYYQFMSYSSRDNLIGTATNPAPAMTEGLINSSNSARFEASSYYPSVAGLDTLNRDILIAYSSKMNTSLSRWLIVPSSPDSLHQKSRVAYGNEAAMGGLIALNPLVFAPLLVFYNAAIGIISSVTDIESNDDPILFLAEKGILLMKIAEGTWIAISAILLGISFFGGICAASSPLFLVLITLILSVGPILLSIMTLMWILGGVMAIYMPAVPFIIFMITALGWFMSVIESIIVAPIVALGLILPAQEELGAIKPAIEMITCILLKPVLMILGLLFASKLYKVSLAFIGEGFQNTFGILNDTVGSSLFSWVGILGLFIGFITVLQTKCYSLIHLIPDKALTWIGMKAETTDLSMMDKAKSTGYDSMTQQFKGALDGGAAGASAASGLMFDQVSKWSDAMKGQGGSVTMSDSAGGGTSSKSADDTDSTKSSTGGGSASGGGLPGGDDGGRLPGGGGGLPGGGGGLPGGGGGLPGGGGGLPGGGGAGGAAGDGAVTIGGAGGAGAAAGGSGAAAGGAGAAVGGAGAAVGGAAAVAIV